MRERISRFMMGRYGVDDFSRFLLAVSFAFLVLDLIFRRGLFYMAAILLLAYTYYRILSKNHNKRYAENMKFTKYKNKFIGIMRIKKSHMEQRKTHHIYKCAKCKQKIRIPRGKGKIQITCPRCGYQFYKKS